jgi:muramoyltetrapeptide carboxypeptidase
MLAQLKLSGILDRLGGLIFGAFTDWRPDEGTATLSLDEVVDEYASRLTIPVARGLVYGHFPVKNTIPVGVRARLEVTSDGASLAVLEPVVSR